MKSILFFFVGLVLGIVTIDCGINAIKALGSIQLVDAGIYGLLCYGIYLLSKKCFKNI